MVRSALAVCSLIAVTASAAGPNRVRLHLDQQQRQDCPSPWCAQRPALYELEAPSDPAMYLGDVISYERPSDWRRFGPLRDKVAELTAGRTPSQKVVAIADWVKRSKASAVHEYESWPPSIIDLWGFSEGQCDEASLLVTAMLRLAGIPAMRFVTWNSAHAAVRAFVHGGWIVVDATPLAPDNSGPARIYAADDPSVVAAFQERPVATYRDVDIPGATDHVDSLTLTRYEPIDDSARLAALGLAYGHVAFPVTNEFLFYDETSHLFVASGTPEQRVGVTFRIEAVGRPCVGARGSWYASPIRAVVPTPLWRTIDGTVPPMVGLDYALGYIETILPACGAWRITYSFSKGDLNAASGGLAYADFSLEGGAGITVIRPGGLLPVTGADGPAFEALVDALARVPTFEQLGGSDQ